MGLTTEKCTGNVRIGRYLIYIPSHLSYNELVRLTIPTNPPQLHPHELHTSGSFALRISLPPLPMTPFPSSSVPSKQFQTCKNVLRCSPLIFVPCSLARVLIRWHAFEISRPFISGIAKMSRALSMSRSTSEGGSCRRTCSHSALRVLRSGGEY